MKVPHNWELERGILGAILLNPTETCDIVKSNVVVEDFHKPIHQRLYSLILDMVESEEQPDFAVVLSRVCGHKDPDHYGGVSYVAALPNACPSIENIDGRCREIRKLATRRNVIFAAQELAAKCELEPLSEEDVASEIDKLANKVKRGSSSEGWITLDEAIDVALTDTQARMLARQNGESIGIEQGISAVDQKCGPLEPGQMIILAARPAMGKTAYALQVARHVARQGYTVAIISLEMRAPELAKRALASEGAVYSDKIRDGRLNDYDFDALLRARDKMAGLPVRFADDASVSIGMFEYRLNRLKERSQNEGYPLGMVIVDYLQLMTGSESPSREQQVAELSRKLKLLAQKLGVPIIVLSQLSRECEKRMDKRPMMSDLRESGAIEQDADKVIALYRDEVYNQGKKPGICEVLILKNRQGASGESVEVRWTGSTTSFSNLD